MVVYKNHTAARIVVGKNYSTALIALHETFEAVPGSSGECTSFWHFSYVFENTAILSRTSQTGWEKSISFGKSN